MSEEKALARLGTLQQGWEMYLEGVPTALIIEKLGLDEQQFVKFARVRAREITERSRAMEKAVVIHGQNRLLKVAMAKVESRDPDLEWARFGLEVLKEQRALVTAPPTSSYPALGADDYDSEKVAEALKKRRIGQGKKEEVTDGTEEGSTD